MIITNAGKTVLSSSPVETTGESNRSAMPLRPESWLAAYVLVLILAAALEVPRWWNAESRAEALAGWLCGVEADVLPFVPWLILLPILWVGGGERHERREGQGRKTGPVLFWALNFQPSTFNPKCSAFLAVLLGGFGFWTSWQASQGMRGLPPAYHDEYSYLFQAETFLAGRTSFPSFEPRPELFDQMHVLNEGRFASRYFPGVGAWLAPFLAVGDPWLGQHVAMGLATLLVYLIGRELSGWGVGLLASLLVALSPGIILFSTLLLSHLPTLVGLMLFLWTYLRGMRERSWVWLFVSGAALTFAMLCRPMTAAGFAFPFGVDFTRWWLRGKSMISRAPLTPAIPLRQRTYRAVFLGGPIVAGSLVLGCYNQSITGSPWQSPYQLYTNLYTPRHVYGFNNVVRGERSLGPKVLDNYDRWAENLTPALAARNVGRRLSSSLRGSLGILPVLASMILLMLLIRRGQAGWCLIAASIVSLHLVHIPYWFEGIMGWHYVFESAPLWLLLVAEATARLFRALEEAGRRAVRWGWLGLLVTAIAVNLVTFRPMWPGRLPRGLVEIAYPRQKYAAFDQTLRQATRGRRSIVLVVPDLSDRHMDYVTNSPSLSATILRARVPSAEEAQRAAKLFPDRDVWLFEAVSGDLTRIRSAEEHGE